MSEEQNEQLISQVQVLLADALQVPADQVHSDLTFGDLPQWDSMGHMEVMLLLEERYGVEINTDNIATLTSLPAICTYIRENDHV